MKRPIFLVGAERSGTTLLRLMLDHHPEIAFCHEFEYAVEWPKQINNLPLTAYHEWLQNHRMFRSAQFYIDPDLTYRELINSFLVQKRDRDHKTEVGATLHRRFDRAFQIWPEARFIHLVRDGRDVALSNMGMGWAGNVWTGSHRWLETEQLWNAMCPYLHPRQYLDLTYEALVANPVKVLTQICQFLQVPYDAAMLNYPQDTTYTLPDPRLVGQWPHRLTPPEIQWVESKLGTMLVERGYKLSGLPIRPLSIWTRYRLYVQDKWWRSQVRRQKLGPGLYYMECFARYLRLKPLHQRIQRQIDNIIEVSLQ